MKGTDNKARWEAIRIKVVLLLPLLFSHRSIVEDVLAFQSKQSKKALAYRKITFSLCICIPNYGTGSFLLRIALLCFAVVWPGSKTAVGSISGWRIMKAVKMVLANRSQCWWWKTVSSDCKLRLDRPRKKGFRKVCLLRPAHKFVCSRQREVERINSRVIKDFCGFDERTTTWSSQRHGGR